MRLSQEISTALSQVIDSRVKPAGGSELFLFGSRVDPEKRGGDIDLLLITDLETKNRFKSAELEMRSALREAAKDQKVDISIILAEEHLADPFFSSIKNLLSLRKW